MKLISRDYGYFWWIWLINETLDKLISVKYDLVRYVTSCNAQTFSKPILYKYRVKRINTGNNLKDMQVLNCWDQNFVEYSMLQNNFIHLSMIWELIQVTMSLIFNIGLLWAVIQFKWDIELASRLTEVFATIWSLIYPFIWMFWKFATMSHSEKTSFSTSKCQIYSNFAIS